MFKKLKFLILTLIFISTLFSACTKKESKNVSVSSVIDKMKETASFDEEIEKDITDLEILERYGISADDVGEGKVYYSKNENKSDEIILIKAKNKDAVENIERALSSEIVGLSNTWKSDETELKKVENHILKTRDDFILLVIGENPKEIEKIFDDMV